MSSLVGEGLSARNAVADMMNPGVQYPHWDASAATKACCKASRVPSGASDSTVSIFASCASIARIEQEYTRLPFTSTVHAPQVARSHTCFAPVKIGRAHV